LRVPANSKTVASTGDLDADPDWGHLHRYHWACPAVVVRGQMQLIRDPDAA